jgi:hypothetical protein
MPSERETEPEKKGFKIVDRRRFTTEGDERDSPDIPPPAPTPVVAKAPPEEKPAAKQGAKGEAQKPEADPKAKKQAPPEDEGGLSFSMFLQSLTQQALMQLGLIPWPHTRQRELHLDQARDTIDVLSLLRTKTKGNLTEEEEQFFETVMYELRMSYVEVTNAIAAGGLKGGPGGPGAARGVGPQR